MSLEARNLTIGYSRHPVLRDLNVRIPQGAVTAIIGPNGCGKSTLLKGLAGLLTLSSGQVLLDGDDLGSLRPRAVARKMTLLPQSPIAPEGIRVSELIARGRTPWLRPFRPAGPADRAAVARAIKAADVADLLDARVSDLSGGQRQRVWIAMALAQETGWLLLDEPTTYLDLRHQLDLLKLVRQLNANQQRNIVMVLHDISLAARFADHLIAMRDGRIMAEGSPEAVISAEVLERIFGLEATVMADPYHGSPIVLPL